MTTALEGGESSASRPGRSLPPGKTRYPLYRRLGGPQGRSGQVRKISSPPGFDPRTVQPVANRYTDYDTQPTHHDETPFLRLCRLRHFFFHDNVEWMMRPKSVRILEKIHVITFHRWSILSSLIILLHSGIS